MLLEYEKIEEKKLSYLSKKYGSSFEKTGVPFVAVTNHRVNLVIWNVLPEDYGEFISFLKERKINGNEGLRLLLDFAKLVSSKPREEKSVKKEIVCGSDKE